MNKQHVQLTQEDREHLETLTSKGSLGAKIYRRAFGLLELDRGKTYTTVSEMLKVTIPTISNWVAQYRENGKKMLQDQSRSGRPTN